MKRTVVLLSVLSLFVMAAAAQAQLVYGQAFSTYAQYGTCCYATNFHIMFCKADANYRPTSQCTAATADPYGRFSFNVRYGSGYYFPYMYRYDIHWGSDSYPMNNFFYILDSQAGQSINGTMTSTPAANPPNAVYPADGAVNVPSSFTLKWTDGLDADRSRSDWPVTYDVYGSGNDAPENLVLSNVPCNGVGTCSATISNISYATRFTWHVVARMHSGPVIPNAGPDNAYLTSSATFHFSTGWDPATPVATIHSMTGYLLKAAGGGGSTFDATGTVNNYETQFNIRNVNGSNSLYSGDQVYIQTIRNYYVSAVNGGGYGTTTTGWANVYETWTIERLAGFGPIGAGDQVSFRSNNGYYMTAEGGGGGTVNANRTAVGPWETFTFQ